MKERPRIGVAAVLALAGLVPRLLYLGQRPLWYDEAFSLLLARQSWPDIVRGTAADTMPPLYYFLLNLWMNLADGIAGLRALNALLGTVAVALVYFWMTEVLGEQEGRLAALLAALSPFLIYHAQELRMYTLLLFGSLLYALGTARVLGSEGSVSDTGNRLASWGLLISGGAVAMYSHNLALFTLAAPPLYLLARRRWRAFRRSSLGLAAVLILAGPWLVILPRQIAKIQTAFWTPIPGALEIVQAFITFHTNLPVPDWAIPLVLASSFMAGALVVYTIFDARGDLAWMSHIWPYLTLPPLGLFLASYLMRPVFVPRAFIFSAVAYLGLVAWAAVRGPLPGQKYVLLAVILIPSMMVLPAQYSYERFPRSPFDQAASFLTHRADPGSVVVHDNKLSFFPMHVYAPELPMEFIRDEPGSHNDTLAPETQEVMGLTPADDIGAAVGDRSSVWFVVLDRAIEEYRELGYGDHPRIRWLRQHYSQEGEWKFNDLTVLRFVAR